MTMHLEGPWLSTVGKKKSKFKYASAEHKARAEQLSAEWEQLKRSYAKPVSSRAQPMRKYSLSIPAGRDTMRDVPSLNTGVGTATKSDAPVYTGTKVKGIGTMHKSNAVPIFSDEEAVDISKMRRG
jgi:hypothetical protein